jgi:predicted Zn-dependent protease with MMP-like domain
MKIDKEQFEKIVSQVIDALPESVKSRIHNLAFFVEDFPTAEQLRNTSGRADDKYSLLGIYEGYIQSSRKNFGVVMPDRITLFRVPIMQSCSGRKELEKRINDTLRHEIAHHFGSDEKGARKAEKKP